MWRQPRGIVFSQVNYSSDSYVVSGTQRAADDEDIQKGKG